LIAQGKLVGQKSNLTRATVFEQALQASKNRSWADKAVGLNHRYQKAKIDFLRFVMCPLLAQLKIGFFSSFSAAAVYSTNEANKAGLKQSIIFRCLWPECIDVPP
jgi:hypothetical protein